MLSPRSGGGTNGVRPYLNVSGHVREARGLRRIWGTVKVVHIIYAAKVSSLPFKVGKSAAGRTASRKEA